MNRNTMIWRITNTKIKVNRVLSCGLAAICLSAALSVGVSADEYHFNGASETEFYPTQTYEDVYGAAYNYGGMNVVDFSYPDLPYGTVSNTLSGSMEKAPIYENRLTYGSNDVSVNYGIASTGGSPVYAAADTAPDPVSAAQVVYQRTAYTSTAGMERRDGSIGTVNIPSLGISLPVWEGETNESMAKGLGHYSSTSGWNGNVGVCGHNRGAKYVIGAIKDLNVGDTINYETVYGTRTYSVSYVGVISNTDWSRLQPTSDNRITITTCLSDQPNFRVCVQATEKI